MILIADSGSTKTNWLAVNDNNEQLFKINTDGLNPAVFPKKVIEDRISNSNELVNVKNKVKKLLFFGAGCGTLKPKLALKEVLASFFKNAEIIVEEDTAAAVYATAKDKPAIVCILGTGSNCTYFDGENIHQKIISLGYIIMDDASGNYYGKKLLKAYYFNKMPKELAMQFESEYNLDADFIKENLYKKDNPNTYLAKFSYFLIENKDHPYFQKMIKFGLREFIENQIFQFEEATTIPIHFVGSVGFFLRDEIAEVFKEYNLKLGVIERHPIKCIVENLLIKKS